MYNKLFTKILDSSIWLAPDPHRLVWITLVAAMDEDAVAHFACAENLAARARVSLPETEVALASFLAPDPYGPDQEFEGRRIERVPGGWYLLNGLKYRTAVTRSAMQEQNRERVRRWREKHRVIEEKHSNVTVMHAEALAEDKQKKREGTPARPSRPPPRKRCPEEFEITEALRTWATTKAPDVDLDRETEKFRDWEFKTSRTDWPACWRTWMSRAQETAKPKVNGHRSSAAEAAWEALVASGGARRTEASQAALERIGGWQRIAMRTPRDEPIIRAEFCKAFPEART